MEITAIATALSVLGSVAVVLLARRLMRQQPDETQSAPMMVPHLDLVGAVDRGWQNLEMEGELDIVREDTEKMREEIRQLRAFVLQLRAELNESRRDSQQSRRRDRELELSRRQGRKDPPLVSVQ
jgi:hypothetical protein